MIDHAELSLESTEELYGILRMERLVSYDEDGNELEDFQEEVNREFFGNEEENVSPYQEALEWASTFLDIDSDAITVFINGQEVEIDE